MSRIVIFDAYGTLFRIDTNEPELIQILGVKKDSFLKVWRSKLLEYSWLTTLSVHWEAFNAIVVKALRYTCEIHHIDFEEIEPILMEIYEKPQLYDDARQLLENTTFRACIMSNGQMETLAQAAKKNGIDQRLDNIFSASMVEEFKVSPKVYKMATAHYNTGPTNMLFVSSNSWDITGAALFGYETVWVNREGKSFDKLIEGPTHEISHLMEVTNLL